jgi:hypothetical protein
VTQQTLFYLPVCPCTVIENIVAANLDGQALSLIGILGSSSSTIIDRLLSEEIQDSRIADVHKCKAAIEANVSHEYTREVYDQRLVARALRGVTLQLFPRPDMCVLS